ncbi:MULTISPECIES: DUF6287 domain-containing protein [Lactococcus]|uniref:DUF6287 domain-containing protein n=1 Tax=Lactococcus lactis subsp. lactis TaxID=1360 RepID=A0AAC9W5Y1_LACLL|nr:MULTISPECIES: DUF6287 domain-containing protein [Lactococcus]ARD95086.1 DUF6287 domain-containing protein [Lactococcus lactis subsp. lactis]ARE07315.1 DUF6287 domain-containing protein [Lactococcus lactis subsp. lactis]MCT0487376.1 hypothetical protein [Lactococcus cremoris]MDM7654464.1 DUF6287 domain-containing protein [Lactococcus cremoris]MRK42487.1 hypothetical protein [Lactococcus lactis subsp. lactis]
MTKWIITDKLGNQIYPYRTYDSKAEAQKWIKSNLKVVRSKEYKIIPELGKISFHKKIPFKIIVFLLLLLTIFFVILQLKDNGSENLKDFSSDLQKSTSSRSYLVPFPVKFSDGDTKEQIEKKLLNAGFKLGAESQVSYQGNEKSGLQSYSINGQQFLSSAGSGFPKGSRISFTYDVYGRDEKNNSILANTNEETKINFSDISETNFSSIVGIWKNENGAMLIITKSSMYIPKEKDFIITKGKIYQNGAITDFRCLSPNISRGQLIMGDTSENLAISFASKNSPISDLSNNTPKTDLSRDRILFSGDASKAINQLKGKEKYSIEKVKKQVFYKSNSIK